MRHGKSLHIITVRIKIQQMAGGWLFIECLSNGNCLFGFLDFNLNSKTVIAAVTETAIETETEIHAKHLAIWP